MEALLIYLQENWFLLLAGLALGTVIGTLTGLFGAGGGFILTPILNIFLNIPMNLAVGTSAAQVLGASSFALARQMDRRFLGIRIAAFLGIGILPGTFLGAQVVHWAKDLGNIQVFQREVLAVNFLLLCVFTVFLLLVAGWMILDNFWLRRGKPDDESKHKGFLSGVLIPPVFHFRTLPSGRFSVPLLILIGLFIGFLSGLLGIGGGVVLLPTLFYVVGQTTKYATQTDLMVVFFAGLCSSFNHALDGNVHYALAVFLIAGAFFGTKVGTVIRSKISGKSIRKYFALVVLFAALIILFKLRELLFG